jgi:hypothetical protein
MDITRRNGCTILLAQAFPGGKYIRVTVSNTRSTMIQSRDGEAESRLQICSTIIVNTATLIVIYDEQGKGEGRNPS